VFSENKPLREGEALGVIVLMDEVAAHCAAESSNGIGGYPWAGLQLRGEVRLVPQKSLTEIKEDVSDRWVT
jgi:hypothetical protein